MAETQIDLRLHRTEVELNLKPMCSGKGEADDLVNVWPFHRSQLNPTTVRLYYIMFEAPWWSDIAMRNIPPFHDFRVQAGHKDP